MLKAICTILVLALASAAQAYDEEHAKISAQNEAAIRGAIDFGQNELGQRYVMDFAGFYLNRSSLSGLDLSGFNFSGANLRFAKLTANFSLANLTAIEARNANFTDADLSHADLTTAVMRKATVAGARFTGANISGANFTRTDITQSQIDSACADPGNPPLLPEGMTVPGACAR